MTQMSERVKEELETAASHIRNALSFASRSENPTTIQQLSIILRSIEELPIYDQQMEAARKFKEKMIDMMNGDSPPPAF